MSRRAITITLLVALAALAGTPLASAATQSNPMLPSVECGGEWHWIHNQTTGQAGTLTVTFRSGTITLTSNEWSKRSIHYRYQATHGETLVAASDDISDGKLVLSHWPDCSQDPTPTTQPPATEPPTTEPPTTEPPTTEPPTTEPPTTEPPTTEPPTTEPPTTEPPTTEPPTSEPPTTEPPTTEPPTTEPPTTEPPTTEPPTTEPPTTEPPTTEPPTTEPPTTEPPTGDSGDAGVLGAGREGTHSQDGTDDPGSREQLPKTGLTVDDLAAMGGVMILLGLLALVTGRRPAGVGALRQS